MKVKTLLLSTISLLAAGAAHADGAAKFGYFSYTGNDARFAKQYDAGKQFLNPVMAGFYPDPSICRKGDTYYLVNSSFSFFPGVPIFKSNDLVNWQQIGHVLDRESQLPLKNQRVSGGIFAPAISYNEKNKTFYMITTNVGAGNFYVKSQDPEKGWSEPIYLPKVQGIDPSFFFDKDGRGYIVNNDEPVGGHDYEGQRSIMLHYFDVKGDSVVGDQIEILRGGTSVEKHPIWIEGPHMFRVGKYYYLMCAEGGTGEWHSEVILRAKKPEGPWEEFSGNPILTQRTGLDESRDDYVSSAGHADIVQGPKGDWWAVFLGCRPYDKKKYYNTGRDTYLLPVTWKDGWPVILEKGKVVPTVVDKPGLQPIEGLNNTGNFSYTDKFEGNKLHQRWMFLRNPSNFYTINNALTINPLPVNISQRESLSAVFCRQQHTKFMAETSLEFTPSSDNDFAGFALLQNEAFNFTFGKTIVDGKPTIVVTRSERFSMPIGSLPLTQDEAKQPIRLKIEGDGGLYDFYAAIGNGDWKLIVRGADASNLTTNKSGGFIGACIGLYATSAAKETPKFPHP
ncbi:MAG: glycoside hydrolase family 43 protein [Prevotella sp.]|nr:glycoside hydrolase family 43 protein [Prevotella sp.]